MSVRSSLPRRQLVPQVPQFDRSTGRDTGLNERDHVGGQFGPRRLSVDDPDMTRPRSRFCAPISIGVGNWWHVEPGVPPLHGATTRCAFAHLAVTAGGGRFGCMRSLRRTTAPGRPADSRPPTQVDPVPRTSLPTQIRRDPPGNEIDATPTPSATRPATVTVSRGSDISGRLSAKVRASDKPAAWA
jgi:hypothetical protein